MRAWVGPAMNVSKPRSDWIATAWGSWKMFLRSAVSSKSADCLFELPNVNLVYQTFGSCSVLTMHVIFPTTLCIRYHPYDLPRCTDEEAGV